MLFGLYLYFENVITKCKKLWVSIQEKCFSIKCDVIFSRRGRSSDGSLQEAFQLWEVGGPAVDALFFFFFFIIRTMFRFWLVGGLKIEGRSN